MAAADFRSVAGHGDVIRHLQRALTSKHVSHAYLLTGEEGAGKRTIAAAFAAALVCEEPKADGDACGHCRSCLRAASHNHPDILYVEHEKPGVITVDEVRRGLVGTVGIRPYEGGRKVYIVPDAEKMNPQAQNAILKTIEEPPSYAVIILLAESEEALLPTILSRCVKLPLMPLPDRQVQTWLEERLRLPDYEARALSAAAQGSIGRALRLATDEEAAERRTRIFRLLASLRTMSPGEAAAAAQSFRGEKESLEESLDTMLLFFRDVYLVKTGGRDSQLVFFGESETIRRTAETADFADLLAVTEELDRARVRLRANVNPELVMENLCLTIRQAIS